MLLEFRGLGFGVYKVVSLNVLGAGQGGGGQTRLQECDQVDAIMATGQKV